MLDISLGLLIFTTIVFLFLVFALNAMLYQPLLAFMRKREDSIAQDMANVDENSEEVEEALTRAHDTIAEAKSEAAKIRESAVSKAKEAAAKEIATLHEKLESEYQSFLQSLSKERESLKKELTANLGTYQKALQAKIKNI
ncbi:MAG: hypothetical protein B6D59_02040 [Campylobacteraceae bacterium 4484_4]|nr:MAG: hypothetical protein B6D59_02040 [Campylobacteraceae bacterium 4484_4]